MQFKPLERSEGSVCVCGGGGGGGADSPTLEVQQLDMYAV